MSKKDFQDIRDFGEGLKVFGEIVSETANYFEAISKVAKDIIPSLEEIHHKQECRKVLLYKKYTLGLTYFETQRLNQLI